ncbi:MAG: DUF7689 domain-containing protein [Pirellulales bacterium]
MATPGNDEQARRKELERCIPRLIDTGYELTSPPAPQYNCVAWAADDTTNRWEDVGDQWYWPPAAVIRDGTIASLIEAFQLLGYEVCETSELESGYQKIALYGSDNAWCHAAKQLPDGRWSSKCGFLDDITHVRLSDVYCEIYGEACCFMKRRLAVD